MLTAGVLIIGFTYVVVTLVADIISALLNPRIRFEAVRMSSVGGADGPLGSERRAARSGYACSSRARASSSARRSSSSGSRARSSVTTSPRTTRGSTRRRRSASPRRRSTSSAPTGSGVTSSPGCFAGSRDILLIAPLATLLATLRRNDARPRHRVLSRESRTTRSAASIDALLAIPLILLAVTVVAAARQPLDVDGDHRHRRCLLPDHRAHGARRRARRGRARLRARRHDSAESARPYVMFSEVLPNVMPPILVEATIRLGYAIFAVATLSFIGLRTAAAVAGLGGADRRQLPGPRIRVVDGALPRARDRIARRRGQPRLGLGPAGARAMSERRRRLSRLRISTSSYRVRGVRSTGASRRLLRDRSRGVVRARGRVGMREVDCGARRSSATCRGTGA